MVIDGDPKKVGRVALSKQNMDESYEGTRQLLARRCFGLGLNLEEDIGFLRTWLSPLKEVAAWLKLHALYATQISSILALDGL